MMQPIVPRFAGSNDATDAFNYVGILGPKAEASIAANALGINSELRSRKIAREGELELFRAQAKAGRQANTGPNWAGLAQGVAGIAGAASGYFGSNLGGAATNRVTDTFSPGGSLYSANFLS